MHTSQVPEPDCIHWQPAALDLEPETCWCPRCGEALPCSLCDPQQVQPIRKEILNV